MIIFITAKCTFEIPMLDIEHDSLGIREYAFVTFPMNFIK